MSAQRFHREDAARLAALAVPAVLAVVARLVSGPHAIDDAYITFRYARNLAEGLGLVYNPGEWVLGTTAPLWAVVLAAGYRLGLTDLPWLATSISSIADAASAVLLVHWTARLGWPALGAACVGVTWALNPMSIAYATGGMETSLFVLCVLSVLGLVTAKAHLPWVALLAGLTTLVRPEGGLLVMSVVGWAALVRPRSAIRTLVYGVTPIGLGAIALWWRYGSPLPNSVAAKQAAYQAAWPLENAVALLLQAGLPGWSTFWLGVVPPAIGLIVAALGLVAQFELVRRSVAAIATGARSSCGWTSARPCLTQHTLPWQPFACFAALYVGFYVLVGLRGIRLFPWYLVPIVPFYLLGAAAGLARLGARRAPWIAVALVLWQVPAIDWHQPLLPAGDELGREQVLLEVGYDLAAGLPSTAVVAAPEIGALGYASRLRILDTVGLVSPAAIPYYPLPAEQLVTDNAIPARLIVDQRPDVVVTFDAFAQRSLLVDADFERDYRLDRSFAAPVWQSQALLIFRRADTVDTP